MFLLALAESTLENIGDKYGFAAMIATAMLMIAGYAVKRMVDIWQESQRARTKADNESHARLVEAQVRSHEEHRAFASEAMKAYQHMNLAMATISKSVESMAGSTDARHAILKQVALNTDQIHKAAKDAIEVAVELTGDMPEVQKKLRDIERDLGQNQ